MNFESCLVRYFLLLASKPSIDFPLAASNLKLTRRNLHMNSTSAVMSREFRSRPQCSFGVSVTISMNMGVRPYKGSMFV